MNLFLVEDEPIILRDLEHIIESFEEDYHIIETATDGQSAKKIIDKMGSDIDVMITDIHIPIMNGLELISYCKETAPHITCIILSGYSEFEYAKKAISLKVNEYLLKPVDEEELYRLLQKAYKNLLLSYFQPSRNTAVKTNPENNIPISSETSLVQVAVLCSGSFLNNSINAFDTVNTVSMNQHEINDHIKNYFSDNENYWIIPGYTISETNIIFSYQKKDATVFAQKIQDCCKSLTEYKTPITIILSNQIADLGQVKETLLTVRNHLSKKIIFGMSGFFSVEDPFPVLPSSISQEIENHLRSLIKLFEENKRNSFYVLLKKLFDKFKLIRISQYQLANYLYGLLDHCFAYSKYFEKHLTMTSMDILDELIFLSKDYNKLYENTLSIFIDLFESLSDSNKTSASKLDIVLKVEQYLKQHYTEPLNIMDLAEYFGFSSAYLSKIFREHKSMSPTDYISKLRIEQAKKLLKNNTVIKIQEVSQIIGYEDPLYFSRVFKKKTGMSPKEYIKKMNN